MNNTNLPLQAMSEIPTPNDSAKSITAVQKRSNRITGYQLDDGTVMNKADAVALARDGGIRGVGIAKNKGNEYLKAIPDGNGQNNLGSLPTV